ncbi:MAG: NAD-dependent epimerase/dehydratase family protein [Bacteroidales bacterium]
MPWGANTEGVTMDVNYKAAVEPGKLSKRNGVKRFVYASSCSMYGA